MLTINKFGVLSLILLVIEITSIIVYIIQIGKSKEKNTDILYEISVNMQKGNMTHFNINKYSYLLSFKRILQIEESDKSYGRILF